MNATKVIVYEGYSIQLDLRAAGVQMWEQVGLSHERAWEELTEIEQEQMMLEAEAVINAALGISE